jgi:hypothetical protein
MMILLRVTLGGLVVLLAYVGRPGEAHAEPAKTDSVLKRVRVAEYRLKDDVIKEMALGAASLALVHKVESYEELGGKGNTVSRWQATDHVTLAEDPNKHFAFGGTAQLSRGDTDGSVLLTPNERRVAEDRRDCFWLYVVTHCNQTGSPRGSKTELILNAIDHQLGPFLAADLRRDCPGVGLDLIRRVLNQRRQAGQLTCEIRGPKSLWHKTVKWNLRNT